MTSRPRCSWAIAVVGLLLTGACTSGGGGSDGGEAAPSAVDAGVSAVAVPDGARPRPTVAAAVEALLEAEARRDRAASFGVLGPSLRTEYPSLAEWERRRNEQGVPIGFDVASGAAEDRAVATVRYEPSLDPFRGLIPGAERQTWTGVEVDGGWLLAAEPEVELILPPDEDAVAAAEEWTSAVQRCDRPAAEAVQGVATLFGDGRAATGLCGSTGDVEAALAGSLETGPAAADIVAQYGTDALGWARVVAVGAPRAFSVVLAPVGSRWLVIGVGDP